MNRAVYSEVFAILNMLGDDYISRLPRKLMDLIISEKVSAYNPEYSFDQPIEEQNISEDALSMITFLNLKYWCDPNEKEELLKVLQENEKQYKEGPSIQQSLSILEQKNIDSNVTEVENKEMAMMPQNVSFWNKIVSAIKHIFNIKLL